MTEVSFSITALERRPELKALLMPHGGIKGNALTVSRELWEKLRAECSPAKETKPDVLIRVEYLQRRASKKPHGWLTALIEHASIEGEHVRISRADYQRYYLDCRNKDGSLKPDSYCGKKINQAMMIYQANGEK